MSSPLPVQEFRTIWPQIVREQGRTLTWLAARTGRPAQSVHRYAVGLRRPPDSWLIMAAQFLGIVVEVRQTTPFTEPRISEGADRRRGTTRTADGSSAAADEVDSAALSAGPTEPRGTSDEADNPAVGAA